jgi:hypothetical protein
MVRAKNVAVFKITRGAAADTAAVQQCLRKLASESGLESKFE